MSTLRRTSALRLAAGLLLTALIGCSSADLGGSVSIHALDGQFAVANRSGQRVYFDAFATDQLAMRAQHLDADRSVPPGHVALRSAVAVLEEAGVDNGRVTVAYWRAVTRAGQRVPGPPTLVELVVPG